jgi:hypothetical protein
VRIAAAAVLNEDDILPAKIDRKEAATVVTTLIVLVPGAISWTICRKIFVKRKSVSSEVDTGSCEETASK